MSRRHAILIVWLLAVAASGWIAWSGQDRLAPGLLDGEHFVQDPEAIAAVSSWRLVCAPGATSPTTVEAGWWADLASLDAIELSTFTSRCYSARWQGPQTATPETAAGDATPTASPEVIPLVSPAFVAELQTGGTNRSLFADSPSQIQADIIRAERFALPLTVLVLMLVTRSALKGAVALLAGATVAVIAIGALTLMTFAVRVPVFVVSVITMLSLALGIDYALLRIIRTRQTDAGFQEAEASPVTGTIAIAGTVVIGASMGLLAMPLSIFRIVLAGIVVVATVAVLAATTLVPCLLRTTGDKRPSSTEAMPAGRLSVLVAVMAAILSAAILATLAWQATGIRSGITVQVVPDPVATLPYDMYLEENLVEIRLSSVEIVIPGPASGEATGALLAFLSQDADFAPIVLQGEAPGSGTTVLRAIVVRPAGSQAATDAIARLRSSAGDSSIGGPLAVYQNVVAAIAERQVFAGAMALFVAWMLMALFTGRPVLGIAALAGSVLSFGAAMGVVVLMFQRGAGGTLTGITPTPHIESWVPIVVFCVVLGMGIDYHLFLLSGYRRARAKDLEPQSAIVAGYRSIGPVVAGAAIAMILVFGGFSFSRSSALQQLGVGLAVGISLDAFLVRLVLLPSVMYLLARIAGRDAT